MRRDVVLRHGGVMVVVFSRERARVIFEEREREREREGGRLRDNCRVERREKKRKSGGMVIVQWWWWRRGGVEVVEVAK